MEYLNEFAIIFCNIPLINCSPLYCSVDPAPPYPKQSVEELRNKFLDSSASLFKRYRAMFALRDDGSDEAVAALIEGLKDSSALFRHEVAYVLGQMQNPKATQALAQVHLK